MKRRAERPPRRGAVAPLPSACGSEHHWRSVVGTTARPLRSASSVSYSWRMAEEQRTRPRVTLSLDPVNVARLKRTVAGIPGGTMSGVVDEMLSAMLPQFEQLVEALQSARRDDGSFDEARGRDALAHWAGQQMLGLSDTWMRQTGTEAE